MDPNKLAKMLNERNEINKTQEQDQEDQTEDEESENENEENNQAEIKQQEEQPYTTRSGRVPRQTTRLEPSMKGKSYHQQHLQTQAMKPFEHHTNIAKVAAKTIKHFNAMMDQEHPKHLQFVETYSLKQGLKKFKEHSREAAYKEMRQLHDRVVFKPIKIEDLTSQEK